MYRWEEFGRVIVDDGKRNGYEGFSEHDQTSGRSRPGEATFIRSSYRKTKKKQPLLRYTWAIHQVRVHLIDVIKIVSLISLTKKQTNKTLFWYFEESMWCRCRPDHRIRDKNWWLADVQVCQWSWPIEDRPALQWCLRWRASNEGRPPAILNSTSSRNRPNCWQTYAIRNPIKTGSKKRNEQTNQRVF